MKLPSALKATLDVLADLFYPRRATCMGCGSGFGCDRDDICEACRRELAGNWLGVRPPDKASGLAGTAFAHRYFGAASGLVRNLKYEHHWLLADAMARDVARAAELLHIANLSFVTAVPMHPRRLSQRIKNHSELLARGVAARLDVPFQNLLRRSRNDRQQARLSHKQRLVNLRGGFVVPPEMQPLVRDSTILLIDDVWTTGSTATACAQALREAGAAGIYFASYAHGERKRRQDGKQDLYRVKNHAGAH